VHSIYSLKALRRLLCDATPLEPSPWHWMQAFPGPICFLCPKSIQAYFCLLDWGHRAVIREVWRVSQVLIRSVSWSGCWLHKCGHFLKSLQAVHLPFKLLSVTYMHYNSKTFKLRQNLKKEMRLFIATSKAMIIMNNCRFSLTGRQTLLTEHCSSESTDHTYLPAHL
jgi:hypothetical protein